MSSRSSSCSDHDAAPREQRPLDGDPAAARDVESHVKADGEARKERDGRPDDAVTPTENGVGSVVGNGVVGVVGVLPRPPHRFKKKSAPLPPPNLAASLTAECLKVSAADPPVELRRATSPSRARPVYPPPPPPPPTPSPDIDAPEAAPRRQRPENGAPEASSEVNVPSRERPELGASETAPARPRSELGVPDASPTGQSLEMGAPEVSPTRQRPEIGASEASDRPRYELGVPEVSQSRQRPEPGAYDGAPARQRPVSLQPIAGEVKPRAPRPASTILETLGLRSAGSVSAKSAPATPHSDWTPPVSPTPPRSPSSSASSRHDKHADAHPRGGKTTPLSTSAPAAAAGSAGGGGGGGRGESPAGGTSPLPPPGTPTPDEPGSSKSRQKKFHRHFKQVAQEERVLNYYSCALVADILLQGQLYITKNYFAFYSNVFGYVTKLLIPTASVVRISKEKTARIIPNAVGVVTGDEKHVFGSLLSRDATYRLMTQVWKSAMLPEPPAVELRGGEEDDSVAMSTHEGYESSLSGSERSCSALTPAPSEAALHAVLSKVEGGVRTIPAPSAGAGLSDGAAGAAAGLRAPRPPGALLAAGTALLVCLFLSAAFLLYRISLMQTRFNDNPLLSGSDHVYQEILKWQAQLHSRSATEVQDFLSSNLDQLAKVRQSLEALSQLLLHNEASARDQRPNS